MVARSVQVFNLTDVSTPALVAAGLVNVTLVVNDKVIGPGEAEDVAATPTVLAQIEHYERSGAVSKVVRPLEYVIKKGRGTSPVPVPSVVIPRSRRG